MKNKHNQESLILQVWKYTDWLEYMDLYETEAIILDSFIREGIIGVSPSDLMAIIKDRNGNEKQ